MTQTTDNRADGWPRDPWAAADGRPTPESDATPAGQAEGDQPEQTQPEQTQPEQTQPERAEQPDQAERAELPPDQQHTQQIPQPEAAPTQPYAYPQNPYGQQNGQQYGDRYGTDPGYGQPQGYQQYGYYPQPGQQTTGYPYAAGQDPAGQPPQPPAGTAFTQPREPRRGPGWFGVATVGVGSALVASLLTAGLVNQNTGTTTSASSPAPSVSTAPQQPGPVTSSNLKSPDWGAVAAAVEPSVVAVKVAGQGGSGEGSGVILDTDGNVLTNNHVVAEASGGGQIEVVLSDGRGYKAEIVGTDPQTDLAVIKISSPPSGLKPATLGDSSAVKVGDPVMAVGNPLGLSDTVTTGIVSAVDRPVTTSGQNQGGNASDTVFTNAIQTDAAINPGNSGGALVDGQGRLVGINSSIASLGSGSLGGQSGNIGLGFAIPVNEAKVVAEQLLKDGKVAHAYLGVNLQDGSVSLDGAQRQTAEIGQVNPNTPASKAGLQAGDEVIAIDGDQVAGADYLIAQVRERRPGQEITLTVVRDGSQQDVKLTLGTRPTD